MLRAVKQRETAEILLAFFEKLYYNNLAMKMPV